MIICRELFIESHLLRVIISGVINQELSLLELSTKNHQPRVINCESFFLSTDIVILHKLSIKSHLFQSYPLRVIYQELSIEISFLFHG